MGSYHSDRCAENRSIIVDFSFSTESAGLIREKQAITRRRHLFFGQRWMSAHFAHQRSPLLYFPVCRQTMDCQSNRTPRKCFSQSFRWVDTHTRVAPAVGRLGNLSSVRMATNEIEYIGGEECQISSIRLRWSSPAFAAAAYFEGFNGIVWWGPYR